ncbi:fumarylacetoacetate hydrolase family protein [Parvularcula maris]|uniref:Fumarylacetoacetate hydrolase family protein n=1 Tax=Parvularcula maris TaxID=2965077 RepID=A0A9X2LA09_9PROT|nr:fumarylacetoacetate hydrolase family protein [Parvularcula maris]MCQ8185873.1 fumarylacetoacetate hydrolase family protein [Parvularcula maris]
MKLVTFRRSDHRIPELGVLTEGRVASLTALEKGPAFSSMQALIDAGPEAWEAARQAESTLPASAFLREGSFTLLAPLPIPVQIRDFMAFELHLRQSLESVARLRAMAAGTDQEEAVEAARRAGQLEPPPVWFDQPVYYKANRFAVSGPDDTILWPSYSSLMDYECELACVIGRQGRDIGKKNAAAHIFGYTVFNDFSARDAQFAEMAGMLGPAKGKDFDGANAMGPCIVTPDEIGDPYDLDMTVTVNGEHRSTGSSSSMHHRFEDMIAWVSRSETLQPGEIFGSGTVGGGCGLEMMRLLEDGDCVEITIEKIGTLTNTIRTKAP